MNVLVIGGAGYIGSHVVLSLLEKGFNVTVFDNLSTGQEINLFERSKFIKGDICNFNQINKAMENIDAIIHLAALKAVGESMVNPEIFSSNNISGTINILNAACNHNIKNIVFSSSATVYGDPQYIPIDEKHPINPINYYGFTKVEIERMLQWYDKLKGLRFSSLRYFNAAGYDLDGRIKGIEKGSQNLLPTVMDVAIGVRPKIIIHGDDYNTFDGTGIRDYIHVMDLAEAHILAFEYTLNKDESLTINLGSEKGISVKEMIDISREITKRTINSEIGPRRLGDAATVIASSKLANKLLNWQPKLSDKETIVESTWNIYQSLIN